MKKGFTLIELMIVVAIIAIIAAIAIPSLLRARMATNATAAAAGLKALIEAQEIYRRTDYDANQVLEYSFLMGAGGALNSLYSNTAVGDLALIDRAYAESEVFPGGANTAATPKAGYVFAIHTAHIPRGGAVTQWTAVNVTTGTTLLTLGHGGGAIPSQYDSTGRDSFEISSAGTIYQKDIPNVTNMPTEFDLNDPLWIPAE